MNSVTETKAVAAHENIYGALCAAQLEFGVVTKGSTNPAFKSRYADLSDVASVVIPTLARHGVAVMHYLVRDDLSAMRTEFVHSASDTRVACDVPLLVDRQNMQGMKSATTYAKRIGLESLSGVAPDDDDGNAAAAAPPREEQRPVSPSPEAIDIAISSFNNAETLDSLKAIWTGLPNDVRAVPAVIKAKDEAKARIETPASQPQNNADLGGDLIPY